MRFFNRFDCKEGQQEEHGETWRMMVRKRKKEREGGGGGGAEGMRIERRVGSLPSEARHPAHALYTIYRSIHTESSPDDDDDDRIDITRA